MTCVVPRRPRLAIAGGLSTALVATLATTGALRGVDQYAVDHVMPWLQVRHRPFVTIGSLTLPSLDGPTAKAVLEVWTYPATVAPSLVILLLAASRLARPEAVVWCVLWCAGNAVELAGKLALHKPALYHNAVRVTAFDASLPSGHTIRALILAAVVAAAWRRGRVAFAWAATVPLALVATGAHAPTDVVAGACVAVTLAGWTPNVRGA